MVASKQSTHTIDSPVPIRHSCHCIVSLHKVQEKNTKASRRQCMQSKTDEMQGVEEHWCNEVEESHTPIVNQITHT